MTQTDVPWRDLLAAATRVAAAHNLIGMFGHLSCFPDRGIDRYLLSPGAGFLKERCTGQDIYELSFDDDWVQGRPLEMYMHSEVHRMRPEIGALVHTHSPALTQLSTLAEIPGDAMLLHAAFWPDVVPVFDGTGLVVGREDAIGLFEVMGDSPLAVMRWHGAVVVGSTLEEAVYRAIFAEENARVMLGALSSGREYIPVPGQETRRRTAEAVITPRLLALHRGYEAARLASIADPNG